MNWITLAIMLGIFFGFMAWIIWQVRRIGPITGKHAYQAKSKRQLRKFRR